MILFRPEKVVPCSVDPANPLRRIPRSRGAHPHRPTSRKSRSAQMLPRRPRGAATGTPKERRISSDSGGSAAARRAPDARMRDSKATPEGSAFVMPEMSTTSSFPARIDFAVFQACSRS